MIRACAQYLGDEALPRWKGLLKSSATLLSLAFGVLVLARPETVIPSPLLLADLSSVLLNYSAIALGFCLAGLTLALTLPDRDFAKTLATTTSSESDTNSYSDLLFIFSWTAFMHWIIIVGSVWSYILGAGGAKVLEVIGWTPFNRVTSALFTFSISYGLIQFLVTVITLSQVGDVYIRRLKSKDESA